MKTYLGLSPLTYLLYAFVVPVAVGGADQIQSQISYCSGLFAADPLNVIRLGAGISYDPADAYGHGGRMVANGWNMFIEWVNVEKGGIQLGNTTYTFQLQFVEDHSAPQEVRFIYNELVSSGGIDFYLGPYSSELTLQSVGETDPEGKLQLANAASNHSIFRNSKYSFSTYPPNYYYNSIPFETFSSLNATSIAVIQDVGYPQCYNVSESEMYSARYGLPLHGHYFVDPNSTSYASDVEALLTELKEADVETLYACSYLLLCTEVIPYTSCYTSSVISIVCGCIS